jgi:hypothetical protein
MQEVVRVSGDCSRDLEVSSIEGGQATALLLGVK